MSESTAEATTTEQQNGGETGFTPPASQQELNRIISERVQRERAKFADYSDLQAKAARADELEQANKTEIEKATDRATAAEAEAAKVPTLVADALRTHLVELHKIPAEKAELFLTAADPALLLRQVTALVGETKKNGNHVAREGTTSASVSNDAREVVRSLFNG